MRRARAAGAAVAVALLAGCVPGREIRVELDGAAARVRLLNIDAPEEPREGAGGECLARQATDALAALLPRGTEVLLVYDEVRFDQYGRLLAGVFVGDRLVNAELARQGLVRPVVFDGNVRFLRAVEEGLAEAEEAGVGMFDPAANCPF